MPTEIIAGAAATDITPGTPQFLYGYPHHERYSTGVHDPLLASSLYLSDGDGEIVIVASDVIYVSKPLCRRVRARIAEATGIAESNVMLTATHTHSGPVTADILSNEADATVPRADPGYITFLEARMAESAVRAREAAGPAEVGLAIARTGHTRTNRHDPLGPADPEMPVLAVRRADGGPYRALMAVHSLHPTVLHEDSTLITADFPGMARQYLQERVIGSDCPVLYHLGPAGNQSPRHVVPDNSFVSARALGESVGRAIEVALNQVKYLPSAHIECRRSELDLIPRTMPSVAEAQAKLTAAHDRLDRLRREGAPQKQVRTAECDWFGAEETLVLAQAAADGRLERAYRDCQPAEIQVFAIGPWNFVAWPGEVFVEYGLEVKRHNPGTFVISLANGELQGYIPTRLAVEQDYYEAGNSIFDYRSGDLLVRRTNDLLAKLRSRRAAPAVEAPVGSDRA